MTENKLILLPFRDFTLCVNKTSIRCAPNVSQETFKTQLSEVQIYTVISASSSLMEPEHPVDSNAAACSGVSRIFHTGRAQPLSLEQKTY